MYGGTPGMPTAEQVAAAAARRAPAADPGIPPFDAAAFLAHAAAAAAPTAGGLSLERMHACRAPERRILGPGDMVPWRGSPARRRYLLFLQALNATVVGRRAREELPASPVRLFSFCCCCCCEWICCS